MVFTSTKNTAEALRDLFEKRLFDHENDHEKELEDLKVNHTEEIGVIKE